MVKQKFYKYWWSFLVLAIYSGTAMAQVPTKLLDKRFGTYADDALSVVKQTKDGGYIIGGSTLAATGNKGGFDYTVLKYTASGKKKWAANFGGDADDKLTALQQTSDGGYILGGYSLSGKYGDKSQFSWGLCDFWVVKINSNGVKQWDKRFGGSSVDCLNSLQQTADGGYILGGYSWSGIDGNRKVDNWGKADYWIVKIDANGEKLWDNRYGGNDYDELTALQQTKDGGYILGGYSYYGISGDKSEPGRGNCDFWVVKTDSTGAKIWDKRFGGEDYDHLYALQQTLDGGYILAGDSRSGISGDKTQTSRGRYDNWVVKIDTNGIKEWDNRYGGKGFEVVTAIQQTLDSGYIIGGESQSGRGGDKTDDSRGLSDYWLVKINSAGGQEWDVSYGGDNYDFLASVQQTKDGGYVLGGSSLSGISGDKTQDNLGGYDFWIVKLNPALLPVSLKNMPDPVIAYGKKADISISPNPASNVIYITGANIINVEIFNEKSNLVLSKKYAGINNVSINITSLRTGMYWVKIKDNSGHIRTEKLWVQ